MYIDIEKDRVDMFMKKLIDNKYRVVKTKGTDSLFPEYYLDARRWFWFGYGNIHIEVKLMKYWFDDTYQCDYILLSDHFHLSAKAFTKFDALCESIRNDFEKCKLKERQD